MSFEFIEADKARIRFALGWTERFHDFDSRLEQAMNALDFAPAQLILGLLDDIDTIYSNLKTAHGRLKAMAVGSIKLPAELEIGMLRSEGRRMAGQLAATLGVSIRHDVFSPVGPRSFAGFEGPFPAGGGQILY